MMVGIIVGVILIIVGVVCAVKRMPAKKPEEIKEPNPDPKFNFNNYG